MSGNYYSIDIWGLLVALAMVAVAAGISSLMRMGIGRTLLWSACRALLQLCAMGFIMAFVIRSGNPWFVLLLIAFMLIAAVQISAFTCQRRAERVGRPGIAEPGAHHAYHDVSGHRTGDSTAPLVCAATGGAADRHAVGQHRLRFGRWAEPFLRKHARAP